MKKTGIIIITIAILMLTGCAEVLNQLTQSASKGQGGGLTSDEIIRGLKEALVVGATNSTTLTSKPDGFNLNSMIRIPFPPEALKVKKTVEKIGLSSLVKDFEESLNRAAEEASKKALPIFKAAVMNMTITDGINILKGPKNAATEYLRSKTSAALTAEFTPVVKSAVEAVEVTKYWNPIASAYNKTTFLTGEKAVNPDLDKYITQKTLDGLFYMIAQEELKIRDNPVARVTDILKKVFGSVR
ncbi:TPA: DUF4197 domain-containing protein [Candidatus Delongbacteria bacterium]|nr:DUF4197 domain-containing protein [Candidatus Delongbacteria bacterium]